MLFCLSSSSFVSTLYRVILQLWIFSASIAFICQPIDGLISGLIMESVGRKWSMIIVNIPFLVGWLLYHFATSILSLFVTNVILGIGIGFMDAPLMTYTAETCQTEQRNILTSVPGEWLYTIQGDTNNNAVQRSLSELIVGESVSNIWIAGL
jgi:MFS family permease